MPARALEIVLAFAAGLALSRPAGSQAYTADTYEERDGLPSGTVLDIAQESTGRMWFATRAGLVSYDGRDWQVELPSPVGSPLSQVAIDDRDQIWTATQQFAVGLMCRPPGGSWQTIAPPEGESGPIVELQAIRDGEQSRALIATRERGLFELWPDGWGAIAVPDEVQAVLDCALRGEHLLLATDAGLWVRTGGRWRRADLDLPDDLVCALAEAGERELDPLWLVGRGWLGLLRGEHLSLPLTDHKVLSEVPALNRAGAGAFPAAADGGAGVWFGQHLRLAHFDGHSGELRYQGSSTGLVASGANALYHDLDGNTWIATNRGISRVSSRRFSSYDHSLGFFADEVNSILEHPPGRLVFGHPGGLTFLDCASKRIETWALPLSPEEAEANPVLDLAVDARGNLWMAAYTLGVIGLSPARERIAGPPFAPGTRAHAVHCDRAGRLWIGTEGNLYRWDGRELVQPADVPYQGPVRRICVLPGERLALATAGFGAWVETEAGWLQLKGHVGGTALETYAVYGDRHGRLWVGAADGLFSRQGDALVRNPLGEEPMQEAVYSINQDAEGRYWFGTQRGVVAWDGAVARRYGVHQGLAGLETNRAANLTDSSGALWFGTIEGVSRYSPADDRVAERALVVELLGVDVAGRLQAPDRSVTLRRGIDDLVFHFRAISFYEEGRIEYRYRLEGHDQDWVALGDTESEFARYTNLPAGTYAFVVQARSPGGPWGPEARSRAMRVRQPFWLSTWFIGLSLLALGGLGIGSWRLLFERRNARELKRQVELRTAELARAQKLESLGLLAGGVAHDFNNLLTAIMAHCELARDEASAAVRAHLDSIDRASERGAGLTQSLLGYARRQAASPRFLRLNESLDAMQDLLRPMIRSEIELQLDLAPDLEAAFLDPGQLEQVVMNLAVNAVDAMPTGGVLTIATANVELERPLPIAHGDCVPGGRWVSLSIRDTGIGMDASTAARVFDPFFTTKPPGRGTGLGLATCHGIVKQNDGFVDFETAPGRGTTFSVYFPAMPAETIRELVPRRAGPEASLGGACVLLVEDDALVRPTLVRSLSGAGCRVLSAQNAEEALRVAREHRGPIDLLISDVIMPGSTGPALREQLLVERPGLRALFISGYTADALQDREPLLSPFELLQKPFRSEELAARAAQLLGQRASPAPSSAPRASVTGRGGAA